MTYADTVITCKHCGRYLAPSRIRMGAHYCTPAEARRAEKARWRARHRPARTEAGRAGFATRFVCAGHCLRPDAVARLCVEVVIPRRYHGGPMSYARGWRYCRTCVCWLLSPERRFCPCCQSPLQHKPAHNRYRWYARHPELAPHEEEVA